MSEENIQESKSKLRRIIEVIAKIFIALIVIAAVIIFVIPKFLSIFWGKDIEPINDSNMKLQVISIPEIENSFYDLDKIKDAINTENIPEGVNIVKDFLNSDEWNNNEIAILLNDNTQAFQYYDLAVEKGKFQSPVEADPNKVSMDSPIVPMNYWREMARLSGVKAIQLAKQGKSDEAINEAFKSIIIGDAIESSQGFLITYLVGISIKKMGIDTLQKVISLTQVDSKNLLDYKEKLNQYRAKDNDAQFKFEYLGIKKTMIDIANGYGDFEEAGVLPINNFYFKPNLTISYSYDFFNKIVAENNMSCGDNQEIVPIERVKMDSSIDFVKLYFTENAIGKMLYSLAAISLNNVITKKCEINTKLELLQNEISTATENAPDVEVEIDSDNDGLSDKDELIYGTDINNPDTDGDGYLDGEEVDKGYNPNGEGKIKLNPEEDILSEEQLEQIEKVSKMSMATMRSAELKSIQMALELYLMGGNNLPDSLTELIPDYLAKKDAIEFINNDEIFYSYSSDRKNYHMGIQLDEAVLKDYTGFNNDKDFNSGATNYINGFNGKDPIYDLTGN